jgi:hypothetical protein
VYDIIGDIHGHADELVALLGQLGYKLGAGVYRHPSRTVIFLGDLIDRGPKIPEALGIVRRMVEAGSAQALMGNHELNILAHHAAAPDAPGEFLRAPEKRSQIQETLDQVPPADLQSHLQWFRTLPLWLDLDGLRIVHACWDPESISWLSEHLKRPIDDEFLTAACRKSGVHYRAFDVSLKGKEAQLPNGCSFFDKHNTPRRRIRLRWYAPPASHTYATYSLGPEDVPCDVPLFEDVIRSAVPYLDREKPVFVGHYGLLGDRPGLLASNVACVDWGVTNHGLLCAYRWDGEQALDAGNFVWVRADSKQ